VSERVGRATVGFTLDRYVKVSTRHRSTPPTACPTTARSKEITMSDKPIYDWAAIERRQAAENSGGTNGAPMLVGRPGPQLVKAGNKDRIGSVCSQPFSRPQSAGSAG
jgi:hypothetical protein